MSEYIYILTNPLMPNIVKIGQTTHLEERVRSLSNHSAVPVPFEIYYACIVEDSLFVEKRIHEGFADHRVNPKREFFRINPERVVSILKLVEVEEVVTATSQYTDPDDAEIIEREKRRQPPFRFSMVGLRPEQKISFIRNSEITSEIVDDRNVHFEGESLSLTKLTLKIMNEQFGKDSKSVQGPSYWEFESETLTDRRNRLEEEEIIINNESKIGKRFLE